MALGDPVNIPREDGTSIGVGDQGDPEAQEPETGKPVHRRGGTEEQCDIDVATASSPYDLIAEGDFESGMKNTGGAEALAGEIKSDDSNTFTVEVNWLNEDGEVLLTHSPAALVDATDLDFHLIVRSDRFEVCVTDTSGAGQNGIHGSVNAH